VRSTVISGQRCAELRIGGLLVHLWSGYRRITLWIHGDSVANAWARDATSLAEEDGRDPARAGADDTPKQPGWGGPTEQGIRHGRCWCIASAHLSKSRTPCQQTKGSDQKRRPAPSTPGDVGPRKGSICPRKAPPFRLANSIGSICAPTRGKACGRAIPKARPHSKPNGTREPLAPRQLRPASVLGALMQSWRHVIPLPGSRLWTRILPATPRLGREAQALRSMARRAPTAGRRGENQHHRDP
jgi:hypothetical protein